MAKLQLLAITTLDGYLFDRTVSSPLWDNPNKYGLTKIRERATDTGWWMKSSFLSHRISKGTAYVCLQKFPVLPHGK